jgi:ribosomal protein S6
LTKTYEGMFLLDNDVVREGWGQAKALVTSTIEKHGGKVLAARRWDERRLAYPIARKQRATYLLAYCEIDGAKLAPMRRDFDLSERVLRYLITSTDAVPESELELSGAELAPDFAVPPPPDDDAPEPEDELAQDAARGDDGPGEGRRRRRDEDLDLDLDVDVLDVEDED